MCIMLTQQRLLNYNSFIRQEIFKFSIYLIAPFGASLLYANPELMHKISKEYNYL